MHGKRVKNPKFDCHSCFAKESRYKHYQPNLCNKYQVTNNPIHYIMDIGMYKERIRTTNILNIEINL